LTIELVWFEWEIITTVKWQVKWAYNETLT
jgi:hypothetical protein